METNEDRKDSKHDRSDFGNDDNIRWHGDDDDDEQAGKERKSKDATRFDDNSADIMDLKLLAELKSIFDRFAVEGVITATEACQALTEAGVFAPRRYSAHCVWHFSFLCVNIVVCREMVQYLRGRKHLGVKRTVSFFEFIRSFAALRYNIIECLSKFGLSYFYII